MSLLEDANMPHRVRIDRMRYEKDEYGGNRRIPVTVRSAVPAWVQNASQREVFEFGKRDELVSHGVYFNADPLLRPGDSVTVTSGPSFVGIELKFIADSDRSAGLGCLYKAMCEEENNERPATFQNAS